MAALDLPAGVTIDGAIKPGFEKVLTKEAVAFIVDLQRKFNARREELLLAPDRQLLAGFEAIGGKARGGDGQRAGTFGSLRRDHCVGPVAVRRMAAGAELEQLCVRHTAPDAPYLLQGAVLVVHPLDGQQRAADGARLVGDRPGAERRVQAPGRARAG